MTDRPIDIPASRIPALLDGRMTQYRTPLKPQPKWPDSLIRYCRECGLSERVGCELPDCDFGEKEPLMSALKLPHAIGDRLWVREPFWSDDYGPAYQATAAVTPVGGWSPSITMPRHLSRLTLTVTDLRVERVLEISEADAIAEGIADWNRGPVHPPWSWQKGGPYSETPREAFRDHWNTTHGPGAWERNDWVLARTFRVDLCNIDQMETTA